MMDERLNITSQQPDLVVELLRHILHDVQTPLRGDVRPARLAHEVHTCTCGVRWDENVNETTEARSVEVPAGKNPAAVELGRLGGRKGGLARAEKLTPGQRSRIARKAAIARWNAMKSEDAS